MSNLYKWACQKIFINSIRINILYNYQGQADIRNLNVPTIGFLQADKSDDVLLYQRLITAYQKATSIKSDQGDGVWEVFSNAFHTQLATYLKNGDCENVGLILGKMFKDPVTTGLMLGEGTYLATRKAPYFTALDWHDKALSFGQAAGVIGVQNPEQGEYGTILDFDSVDVLSKTVERLGLDPLPPQIGALFGVKFRGGVIPVNHLLHLYTAHRVSTILPNKNDACMEIGGGVGLLAYVMAAMGFKEYCIVDLPLVNVIQGYLLLKSKFAGRVQLYGENKIETESRIRIFPSNHVNEIPNKSFDLIINQDSLPEMGRETMIAYLKSIQKISRQYFLSINQEAQASQGLGLDSAQGWVHEACRNESGLSLVYRAPYWMRKGYVEELYNVIQ